MSQPQNEAATPPVQADDTAAPVESVETEDIPEAAAPVEAVETKEVPAPAEGSVR